MRGPAPEDNTDRDQHKRHQEAEVDFDGQSKALFLFRPKPIVF